MTRALEVITSGELGGAQQHVVALVTALASAGIECAVACGPGEWLARSLSGVADVHVVPTLARAPAPIDDARALGTLIALCRGQDVVHTHSAKAGVLGRLAARIAGARRIYHTSHGSYLAERRHPLARAGYRAAEKMVEGFTDRLFVLSQADLELMRAAGLYRATAAEVICVPTGRVASPPTQWKDPDRPRVVTVANLYPAKGVDILLRAFALVRRAVPQAELVIVGDGPEHARLHDQIPVDGSVVLAGRIEDPSGLVAGASVFVMPSRKEGMPLALLEAMAMGVPSIATDVGGVREVAGDGEVLIVAPEDDAALARAIERVLASPVLRAELSSGGLAAARRFVDLSSLQRIALIYDTDR